MFIYNIHLSDVWTSCFNTDFQDIFLSQYENNTAQTIQNIPYTYPVSLKISNPQCSISVPTVGPRDSYKEPSVHVTTAERYSPVRRASEGSGSQGPNIQALQQEYQQLQKLASPLHSPASIPGSPVHERGVAAITQGTNC